MKDSWNDDNILIGRDKKEKTSFTKSFKIRLSHVYNISSEIITSTHNLLSLHLTVTTTLDSQW